MGGQLVSSNVLMTGLLRAQDIVHIEDIIAVLVIVAVVLHSLARLGKDAPRVPRRLVLEGRVAYSVSGGEVNR